MYIVNDEGRLGCQQAIQPYSKTLLLFVRRIDQGRQMWCKVAFAGGRRVKQASTRKTGAESDRFVCRASYAKANKSMLLEHSQRIIKAEGNPRL